MILKPSPSKSKGCECLEGLGNLVQGHIDALLNSSLFGWILFAFSILYTNASP